MADQIIADRFEVGDFIAQGGMGAVYRGLDRQTGQTVAIKSVRPELVDAALIARFQQEGETLRTLNHPNIVKLVMTVQDGDQHYLVMEYVSGGSLADLLAKQSSLAADQTVSIALELADALARAHHLKVIHRDLKPANVLLADDGTPRLTDFGVARTAQGNLTGTGVIVGTLSYLAPEILNGEPADARADIWAFGVTLFELLTGRLPFRADSPAALITAILTQPTPDLESLRPELPVALVDLIYRMLEKDRNQRINSVRLVAAELEAILRGGIGAVRARPASQPIDRIDSDSTIFASQTPSEADTPHNLPAQTTEFVGREAEIAELEKLLTTSRLITILGTGGMGKSRLSVEVAHTQRSKFSDGVYFVSLAPLSDPETIIGAIAEAARFSFSGDVHPRQQILDFLRAKHLLLVMDNFEHLLAGVGLVSEILQAAPNVKILSTSRERLNVEGETIFRLEGIDFPDWETPADAAEYSAVKLFLQSACRVEPTFALDANNLKYVARICRLVQGMPLGILLAAAWVEALTLSEIAQEIEKSLSFLESDRRDLPARQRSLRATFDYSWNLLNDAERDIFKKLSIFRGGFAREAAQQVAGASIKTLIILVNKSLLRRNAATGRYEIHELLRQFGAEKLEGAGLTYAIQNDHANYFAFWMNELWLDLKGRRQIAAIRDVDTDFNNLRVAWLYLAAQRQFGNMADFANVLWMSGETSIHRQEVADLFEPTIKAFRAAPTSHQRDYILGLVLGLQGRNLNYLGSPATGKILAEEGIGLLEHFDNAEALIQAWHARSFCSVYLRDKDSEHESAKQALRIARERNHRWGLARSLYCVGSVFSDVQNYEEALRCAQECLSVAEEVGDIWQMSAACNQLGGIFTMTQKYNEAIVYRQRALSLMEQVGAPRFIGMMIGSLGDIYMEMVDLGEARHYYWRYLKFRKDHGGLPWELLEVINKFSYLLQIEKQYEYAVELTSLLLNHAAISQGAHYWAELQRAELETQLPPDMYRAAWDRGKALDLDTVVAEILAEPPMFASGATNAG